MDSAFAARSTASSFRFGGRPHEAGATGLHPAVPQRFTRGEHLAGQPRQSCPRYGIAPVSVSEVRTDLARHCCLANSGLIPVYAGPSKWGIKRQSVSGHRRRQSWTGRPHLWFPCGTFERGSARLKSTKSASFPFQMSRRDVQKGLSSYHRWFVKTRKGVPTKGAGTPDGTYLECLRDFAKGLFRRQGLFWQPPPFLASAGHLSALGDHESRKISG